MTYSSRTEPEVFIIESLNFDDEEEGSFEGKFISQILNMNGKESIYYYIRTKKELEEVMFKFDESNFRYLHISCHGSPTSMETTLDSIPFKELAEIVNPSLQNKRLFISACNMCNRRLANLIIKESSCYSIVGPHNPINFSDAAIFWASFYHLMFNANEQSMKLKDIREQLIKLSTLFNVPISFFRNSSKLKAGYAYRQINPRKIS